MNQLTIAEKRTIMAVVCIAWLGGMVLASETPNQFINTLADNLPVIVSSSEFGFVEPNKSFSETVKFSPAPEEISGHLSGDAPELPLSGYVTTKNIFGGLRSVSFNLMPPLMEESSQFNPAPACFPADNKPMRDESSDAPTKEKGSDKLVCLAIHFVVAAIGGFIGGLLFLPNKADMTSGPQVE